MASALTVLTYGEREKYDELLNALEDASVQADCGSVEWTKPLSNQFRFSDGHAHLTAYVHLRDWRWRGTSRKGIHILLSIQETIRCSDKVLVSSCIHSDYYLVQGGAANFLQSVRFDFEGTKDCHPLFHAQLNADRIALAGFTAKEIGFEYQIDPAPWTCFRDARIPTSDMTLPSVLLCLAADHFGKIFFCQFREEAMALQEALPHPAINSLSQSLMDAPRHIRSSHWFAHTIKS